MRRAKIIWLGIFIAVFYWVAESVLHSLFFTHLGLWEAFFAPDLHEAWMRCLSVALIIAFAARAQSDIYKYDLLNSLLLKEREELKQTKALLENIIQGMPDGILLISQDYKVLWANRTMVEMSGYGMESLIGQHCYEVTHRRDTPCEVPIHTCPIRESAKSGNPATVLHTHLDKKGNRIFIEVSVYPIRNKEGEITQYIHVSRDITERKHLENLKDDFVNTVSHELRTPLAITKEGIEIVLDGTLGDINKEQDETLQIVKNNIDRLSRIVDNLLDISKISARKLGLRKEVFNIADSAKKIISNFESGAKKKGLELRCNFSGGHFDVYADQDKIIQVFVNLISNSLKFTQSGSIEISIKEKEDAVECSVKDTGMGIAAKDVPRVFEKFQQFTRAVGSGEKGTGLGLAIVKEIIELHGGKIWLESELNKGSCFTFSLPKYSPAEEKV